jgi:hypothetical protein
MRALLSRRSSVEVFVGPGVGDEGGFELDIAADGAKMNLYSILNCQVWEMKELGHDRGG